MISSVQANHHVALPGNGRENGDPVHAVRRPDQGQAIPPPQTRLAATGGWIKGQAGRVKERMKMVKVAVEFTEDQIKLLQASADELTADAQKDGITTVFTIQDIIQTYAIMEANEDAKRRERDVKS